MISPTEQLRRAVTNPGPRPKVHYETTFRHRREWPALWAAIDRILAESKQKPEYNSTHMDTIVHQPNKSTSGHTLRP